MEGQGFRDRAPEFDAAGADIVGASFDTPADNARFAAEQGFGFPLLSDPDRTLGEAYGVGRPAGDPFADFPRRVTFLVRPDGTVAKVYEVSDTAAHPQEVLDDLRVLASGGSV